MMQKKALKAKISTSVPSIETLIECAELIRSYGDVVMIKLDGGRIANEYTILIMFPKSQREMIRVDGNSLRDCLLESIKKYIMD